MKTVLITGVAGLLGSRLADWILEHQPGVAVVGIDDLSGGYLENVDSRVTFYNIDLGKASAEPVFSAHRPGVAYHFAAYAYTTWQKSADLLGFEHTTSMHKGLAKMWAWAQQQPVRARQVWSQYELEQGLYPYWQKDVLRAESRGVQEIVKDR